MFLIFFNFFCYFIFHILFSVVKCYTVRAGFKYRRTRFNKESFPAAVGAHKLPVPFHIKGVATPINIVKLETNLFSKHFSCYAIFSA